MQFSQNVKEIGSFAFNYCTSLKEISLPKSLEKIGDGAFIGCSSLNTIKIKNDKLEIGKLAFNDCPSIKTILVPNKLNCKNLLSIEAPDAKIEFIDDLQQ